MDGQEFTVLPGAHPFVRKVIEKGRLVPDGDGAFSRVYAIDRRTVLKVTTCQATRLLFNQLIRKPTAGCLKVFKAYGKVAVDEDGFPYYAFIVERLYSQKEWQTLPDVRNFKQKRKHTSVFHDNEGLRRRARASESTRGLVKQRWREKRKGGATLENALRRIRRPIKRYLTEDGRQKGGALIYHVKRQLGLTGAMEMLRRFIGNRNIELDLLVPGNVLLTREGNICLSDPVTEMFDNTLPAMTPFPIPDGSPNEDVKDSEDLLAELSNLAPLFRFT